MLKWQRWIPAGVLALGAVLNISLVSRRAGTTPLAGQLSTVADTVMGVVGVNKEVGEDEKRVAGFTDYLLRTYTLPTGQEFGLYVGYYDEQRQGKSIHSPRNCLPGGGWEPVSQRVVTIPAGVYGDVGINRYEIVKEQERAIVYYWYQGRGRVEHNEYSVKFQLLRDAAVHGRTEEALVRIVVPVTNDDVDGADKLALEMAASLIADVDRVLPKL
jgi:EpsI family protein